MVVQTAIGTGPVELRLVVVRDSDEATIEAWTSVGRAHYVGEGWDVESAIQALVRAVRLHPGGNATGPPPVITTEDPPSNA